MQHSPQSSSSSTSSGWGDWSYWSEWAHSSEWSPWSARREGSVPFDDAWLRDELGSEPRSQPTGARDVPEPGRAHLLQRALHGALLALALLAGVAAFTGRSELFAGLNRIRAERQLENGNFASASALLGDALASSPDSARLLLLKIKADLLAGNANAAFGLVERFGDRAGDPGLVAEINPILERVALAVAKAQQAEREADVDLVRAARLWQEAAELYPESSALRVSAGLASGTVAFERRNLTEFMQLASELAAQHPEHPFAVAQLASAQAALYAATGEAPLRAQAETTLARAQQLALAFAADPRELARQVEPIRYRLASREILTRHQYERRFPTGRSHAP
jgi:hypothetical protein